MLVVQNPPPRLWWLVGAVCWTECLLRASIFPQEFHIPQVFCHFQSCDCSSRLSHGWNLIEVCLGNALLLEVFTASCHNSLGIIEDLRSIFWFQVNRSLLLPSVYCRRPSCRFCQQLSAASLPSFPTSLTSVHGCVFVAICRHLCMLQWWI